MKTLKARFIALCGLMVLLAATLVPVVAEASCPTFIVDCANGDTHICRGTADGSGHCTYNESCFNC
jgi:hypothetical protein